MRVPLLPTAAAALTLGCATIAIAQPVITPGAGQAPAGVTPTCSVVRSSDTDAEVACLFGEASPRSAQPHSEGRVLIRAQFTPQRCAGRTAQVLDFPGAAPQRPVALPQVEHATSRRGCVS